MVGSVKGHNEYGVELFCGDRIGFIRNDFLSDTPVENVAQSFHIGIFIYSGMATPGFFSQNPKC